MIAVTKCQERGCRHWRGVYPLDDKQHPEADERPRCKAFPDGIPAEIAYGDDLHLLPVKGDNDIQFEAGKWLDDLEAEQSE